MTREQNLNTLIQKKTFCYDTRGKRGATGGEEDWVGRWGSTLSEAEEKVDGWRTQEGHREGQYFDVNQ